jgi:hypothetical protein
LKTKRLQKRLSIIGIAVFLVFTVIVIIGLIIGPPATDSQRAESSKTTQSQNSDSTKDQESAEAGSQIPTPEYDGQGLAIMPVTQDPRAAAAGAAAVLWSVDTSKIGFAEDFRKEALTRVMQPSPEYVGVTGQIHTGIDPVTGKAAYLDPLTAAQQATAKLNYRPDGWWWMLGDENSMAGLRARNAIIKSQAQKVYDADEMQSFDGAVGTTFSGNADTQIDKEGASLGIYWVRTDSELQVGETIQQRFTAALAIYCDPPGEGGLCGVAALMTDYPQAWQRQ